MKKKSVMTFWRTLFVTTGFLVGLFFLGSASASVVQPFVSLHSSDFNSGPQADEFEFEKSSVLGEFYFSESDDDSGGASGGRLALADDDFADFSDEFGEEARKERADVYDPWIGYNRAMFKFNDWMYENILRPSVRGYNWIVPQGVRVSLAKFFHNLMFPLRFVNNLLQFKLAGAGIETGRFIMNTTFGIGGIFDPADHYFGWLPRNEDFGQTLAYWGVGEGPPFVIPFLGQSNLRDAIGILPQYAVHPVYYLADKNNKIYLAQQAVEYFNFASLHYEEYDSIKKDALDPYTFTRDAYHQSREKQVNE